MNHLIQSALQSLLSHGEIAALRTFREERTIAAHHRFGLRHIRSQFLSRPARLNLGSGPHRKQGFLNVNSMPGGDVTLDLRLGLPFESNCAELIFSEHCFEHLDYPEPITFLFRECVRVLRPGGTLSFSVPGTEWPLTDYRDGADAPYSKLAIYMSGTRRRARLAWNTSTTTSARGRNIGLHTTSRPQRRC